MEVGAKVDVEIAGVARTYTVKGLLGSGAIAIVYRAELDVVPIQHGQAPRLIAIKECKPNLSVETQQRFFGELDFLSVLREQAQGRYFPAVWPGRIRSDNQSGVTVFAIEQATGKPLTSVAAEGANHMLDEVNAVTVAVEYAKMLEVLYTAGYSCPDRKPDDLYWTAQPGGGRLLVLDWNVVHRIADRLQQIQDDIYIFGRIWYELLLGVLPSSPRQRQEQPLSQPAHWSTLSLSLRSILQNALAAEPQRYPIPQALIHDLEQLAQWWQTPPAMLLDEARRATQSLTQKLTCATLQDLGGLRNQLLECQKLIDLVQRRNLGNESLVRQLDGLQSEIDRIQGDISRLLRNKEYRKALPLLDAALAAAELDTDDALHLALLRYRLLAEAGQKGAEENKYLSAYINRLLDIAAALEMNKAGTNINWPEIGERWGRLRQELDRAGWTEAEVGQPRRLLDRLDNELWARQRLAEMAAAESEGRPAQALHSVREIMARLDTLTSDDDRAYFHLVLRTAGYTLDGLSAQERTWDQASGDTAALALALRTVLELGESGNWESAADVLSNERYIERCTRGDQNALRVVNRAQSMAMLMAELHTWLYSPSPTRWLLLLEPENGILARIAKADTEWHDLPEFAMPFLHSIHEQAGAALRQVVLRIQSAYTAVPTLYMAETRHSPVTFAPVLDRFETSAWAGISTLAEAEEVLAICQYLQACLQHSNPHLRRWFEQRLGLSS